MTTRPLVMKSAGDKLQTHLHTRKNTIAASRHRNTHPPSLHITSGSSNALGCTTNPAIGALSNMLQPCDRNLVCQDCPICCAMRPKSGASKRLKHGVSRCASIAALRRPKLATTDGPNMPRQLTPSWRCCVFLWFRRAECPFQVIQSSTHISRHAFAASTSVIHRAITPIK